MQSGTNAAAVHEGSKNVQSSQNAAEQAQAVSNTAAKSSAWKQKPDINTQPAAQEDARSLLSICKDDITDIRAEKILEQVRECIENTHLRKMIDILEEYLEECDDTALEVAAALMMMQMGQGEEIQLRQEDFGDTGAEPGMVRLFINIGKKQRVRIGDVLGAIAGESGMAGDLVGAIDMYDKYTFVEVPREYGKEVLKAMSNSKIKGKSINIEPANQK